MLKRSHYKTWRIENKAEVAFQAAVGSELKVYSWYPSSSLKSNMVDVLSIAPVRPRMNLSNAVVIDYTAFLSHQLSSVKNTVPDVTDTTLKKLSSNPMRRANVHATASFFLDPSKAYTVDCCIVPGCDSRFEKTAPAGVYFHRFPANEQNRHRWLKAIFQNSYRPDWEPYPWHWICSIHFATGVLNC